MEPIDYGGALRRSWRLLLALAIVGAVVAVLVPVGHAKKVKSAVPYTALAVVGTAPNGPNSPLNGAVTASQIAFIANSTSTLQDVADKAGLDVPDSALPGYFSAAVVSSGAAGSAQSGSGGSIKRNTPTVVNLTTRASTADDAVRLANIYSTVVGVDVQNAANDHLAQKTGGGQAYTGYTVIRSATYAGHGTKAKASLTASRKVRGVAGLVIGALVGAAIVLLRELIDKRLRNASRAEANFGFPVVVEIPSPPLSSSSMSTLAPMVDAIRDPDSAGAEAYRKLRMSVMFEGLASLAGPSDPYAMGFDAGKGGLVSLDQSAREVDPAQQIGDRHVVLVLSAGSEPARPYVAANLAAVYAEAGQRVIVISTGGVDAVSNGRHSATVTGDIRPEDIETHLESSRLDQVLRLPLDPFISRSGQLVMRMPAIIEAARQVSDVIVLEVPPLLTMHHAEALLSSVDVVLVVAQCRVTTFDQARRAGELLRRMGAPVLGVVLTGTRSSQSDHQPALSAPPPDPDTDGDGEPTVAIGAGVGSTGPAAHHPD